MKKTLAATLFGLLASASVTSNAAEFVRYMNAGEILNRGDVLRSPNNLYRLVMQYDGNLVLYFFPGTNGGAFSRWSSGSNPNGYYAAIQYDGNLAVYTGSNTWAWQAGNGGKPTGNYQLVLEDDGHLFIANPPTPGGAVGFYSKDLHWDTCPSGVPAATFPATTNQSTTATFYVSAICGMKADEAALNAHGQLTGFFYWRR
jgi:hypothetical protein